jgi:hypothetical protein
LKFVIVKQEERVSKNLVIRTRMKPEGKKYLPGRDTQVSYATLKQSPADTRISPAGSRTDRSRMSEQEIVFKATSDASFHTFSLSFSRAFVVL